jgi:APA family basic amino acid/polyamine antiporter
LLPAVYLLLALFIEVQLLRYKPQYTWPGLLIVASGIPMYALWRIRQGKVNSLAPESAQSNASSA